MITQASTPETLADGVILSVFESDERFRSVLSRAIKGLAPRGDEIGIHAIRGGDIIGDHLVLFAGDGERIEIKHQAHSRQAFAGGAIKAARWVVGAPIGVHGMEEVLGL